MGFTCCKELARYECPKGIRTMAIKLIIAVYFALVATMFAARVVMLSLHNMQESRFSALDNSHLVARVNIWRSLHGHRLVWRDHTSDNDLDRPRHLRQQHR